MNGTDIFGSLCPVPRPQGSKNLQFMPPMFQRYFILTLNRSGGVANKKLKMFKWLTYLIIDHFDPTLITKPLTLIHVSSDLHFCIKLPFLSDHLSSFNFVLIPLKKMAFIYDLKNYIPNLAPP
jgi:hypothetical protein